MKIRKPESTDREATKMFIDFIKNIFHEFSSDTKVQQASYPVFIGFNGYDIIPQHVETYFDELNNYFDVFYFDNFSNTHPNRIIYRFKVGNIKVDMEYMDFLKLLQRVIEKILIQHLRNYDVYLPGDNLVSVNILNGVLCVSLAKNDVGIIENKDIRRKIKNNYYHSKELTSQGKINVNWNEDTQK